MRREGTRTRRAARHANIGFSVRTFGPSARKRLFGALFPPYGWMARDGERDSSPMKKPGIGREQLSSPPSFHEDRPTDRSAVEGGEGDERRGNSGERIADRPSQEISKVGTWSEISPSFPFVVADTCLFL